MSPLPIPIDAGTAIPHPDPKWSLVERIVASQSFRKTARLKDLLSYLAEMSLRGDHSGLSEQQIGQAVFGKSAGYSPVEDSSVRVHIRQLRLKLHEYFDSDGRDEVLVVEIPKGGYTLAFRAVPVVKTEAPAPLPEPQPVAPPVRRTAKRLLAVLPWIMVAALSILAVILWQRSRTPASPAPPWPLSAVFGNGHRSEIVLADSTYAIGRLMNGESVSLESYMRRDFQHKGKAGAEGDGNETFLERYTADALLTSWADVAVATALLRLMPSTLEHVTVRSARDLHPRDLEDGNYIFVGSPASNPWVLLFENRLNFREQRGDEVHGATKSFLNTKPRAGEQTSYQGLARTGLDGVDYATIALLPADSGRGNILIIQGLQQEGAEAAGLLLADESGRKKLKKALGIRSEPSTALYFEILLRIGAVGGSPKSANVVASRILKY